LATVDTAGERPVFLVTSGPIQDGFILVAAREIQSMDYSKIIIADPAVRSGKPSVRDTRATVSDVLEYLAGGMSEDEILADFPYLTRDDIRACPAVAAERERRILSAAS
jgi:uncharacterized protein (DUF433 family)